MGKALMICATGQPQATANEVSLLGAGVNTTGLETNTLVPASETLTFSKLGGSVTLNGSGDNNLRFRNNAANGNQLATVTGPGISEDTVNTDTVTAGNTFNLAITDTGTDPTYAYMKCNVEFASGHGVIHGCAHYPGQTMNSPSVANFLGITGDISPDGASTEANVAYKNRGYTSIEAMSARANSNARVNNTTIVNRKNGVDGTGSIVFAAGTAGLIQDTSIGDSIADGDLINASITYGTGTENLFLCFVTFTLKSTTLKSECAAMRSGGLARAASATPDYIVLGGRVATAGTLTEAQAAVKVGFIGRASNLRCYLSANTYTANGTLKLFKNGSAVLTTTITLLGGAAWYENTTDTVDFIATDTLSFEITGGTTGSITIQQVGVTLEDRTPAGEAFRQSDWPLPLPKTYSNSLRTFASFFAPVSQPFFQNEWPLPIPKVYPHTLRSHSYYFPTVDQPFRQSEWPLPTLRPVAVNARGFTTFISPQPVVLPAPFFQSDWPNPIARLASAFPRAGFISVISPQPVIAAQPFIPPFNWQNPILRETDYRVFTIASGAMPEEIIPPTAFNTGWWMWRKRRY